MDPALGLRRASNALSPLAHGLVRNVSRMLFDSPVRGSERGLESPLELEPDDALAAAMVWSLSPEERDAADQVLLGLEQWLKGRAPARSDTLSGAGNWVQRWLRERLRTLAGNRSFYDLSAESPLDRRLKEAGLPARCGTRILIAGHTHAARAHQHQDERVYLNTGTWTPLLVPPRLESDADMQSWLKALETGTAPTQLRQTFAEVTSTGPMLCEWWEGEEPTGQAARRQLTANASVKILWRWITRDRVCLTPSTTVRRHLGNSPTVLMRAGGPRTQERSIGSCSDVYG